jgi:hypothetical protein
VSAATELAEITRRAEAEAREKARQAAAEAKVRAAEAELAQADAAMVALADGEKQRKDAEWRAEEAKLYAEWKRQQDGKAERARDAKAELAKREADLAGRKAALARLQDEIARERVATAAAVAEVTNRAIAGLDSAIAQLTKAREETRREKASSNDAYKRLSAAEAQLHALGLKEIETGVWRHKWEIETGGLA